MEMESTFLDIWALLASAAASLMIFLANLSNRSVFRSPDFSPSAQDIVRKEKKEHLMLYREHHMLVCLHLTCFHFFFSFPGRLVSLDVSSLDGLRIHLSPGRGFHFSGNLPSEDRGKGERRGAASS